MRSIMNALSEGLHNLKKFFQRHQESGPKYSMVFLSFATGIFLLLTYLQIFHVAIGFGALAVLAGYIAVHWSRLMHWLDDFILEPCGPAISEK